MENEGSRGMCQGELALLCLDKKILGPHCNPQYDGEEAHTCFVSTQGTGVYWASTPCQALSWALKSSVRGIVIEEETWAGSKQELALTPEPSDCKTCHTDSHTVQAAHNGKTVMSSLSLISGGRMEPGMTTWKERL